MSNDEPPGTPGGFVMRRGQAMTPWIAALLAALMSAGLVRLLWSGLLADLVVDIPNDRSLHVRPTPRTGGLGLMVAAMGTALLLGGGPASILLPATVLAALFLADDVGGLSVTTRFAAQFAAACVFLLWSGAGPFWLLPPLLVGIVWSTNLYNFMDGSNGLAGGMAVVGFGAYAIAAGSTGATDLAILSAAVAGAAAGFLLWNFDPARIFLGDAGSIPLGFMAAAIGVLGWQRGLWPFWFPVMVFAVFIVDSGLTLAKRLIHRENPFKAHRSHYYQRLIRMGWSHRRLALSAYALMLATAATALAARTASPLTATVVLALWVAGILAISVLVDRRWRASPIRGT